MRFTRGSAAGGRMLPAVAKFPQPIFSATARARARALTQSWLRLHRTLKRLKRMRRVAKALVLAAAAVPTVLQLILQPMPIGGTTLSLMHRQPLPSPQPPPAQQPPPPLLLLLQLP